MDPPSLTSPTSNSILTVYPDVIETQIFARLDASAIASASCVSSQLNSLATSETLWTNICHATWPSTKTPRMRHAISTFPKGPFSFFSDAITNPDIAAITSSSLINLDRPSKLISAVDVYYQKRPIFSKVIQTESFDGNPFRIDLLDPEDSIPTRVPYPVNEHMMDELGDRLTLSWILIDPIERRAMNLSSYRPVIVERRWLLTEEVHVRYGWVFSAGEEGSATEYVKCGITVTWEGCQRAGGRRMYVSKVSLDMEDMYGKQMSGEDSLVIFKEGMGGKRGNVKWREGEERKRRYEEYMEMRRERILKQVRELPGTFELLYDAFTILMLAFLGAFVFKKLIFQFCF